MQKLLTLLFICLFSLSANAQFKVLFVDDSGDDFGNAELLAASLDSLGIYYDYADAYGQSASPTIEDMANYDLVIWYTSTWGVGLQLWGGADVTNPELVQYLSQPNANLWLIGLDYFYDRYGVAPVTFQAGDFAYDYLGISKYAVQTFEDDGGDGVPLVTPASGQPIPGIGDINWQFSTLWYADGFELRPEATPVYLFGGNNYVLNGTPTGTWFRPSSGARVLTYGFDLALASNSNLIRNHVGKVLQWWQSELTGTQSPNSVLSKVRIYPNTFTDHLEISLNILETVSVSIQVCNATGQTIAQLATGETMSAGTEQTISWAVPAGLPSGVYYCTVQAGQTFNTTKIVRR